ncbi:MAG: hypothetical protein R2759_05635 [Bacteroidales bacterium]
MSDVRSNPADYYFINSLEWNILNNPRSQQKRLITNWVSMHPTNKSSLRLSAFYREMRDDIQIYRFTGAYPRDYTSYNNLDLVL